ncbi:MAG: hypothetical protein M0R02_01275 [Bacteroidales bacterium]|nr:hypothetical protein [Bacteroidales bacterium]HPY82149.1 hypothetical protein [Bacteroidales bacterium]
MKKHIVFLTVIVGLLVFNSCKKENDSVSPLTNSTSLELTIKNNIGNSISGASVKLYASGIDRSNKTNQVGTTQFSDASGKVVFNELSNIKYYFLVEKDCQNNINGGVTTTSALIANKTTVLDIILSETGTLKFVNTSSNPYRVYINGSVAFDMNGGTTKYENYMSTGFYSIRVLQLSGYLFTATDKTYTGTLGCGQTMTVTFP